MLNKKTFCIGPKIGGFFHLWFIHLGSELVNYTNFKGQALHLVPILGFGHSSLKISIGLHVPLKDNLFEHIGVPSIGFTYEIKNLQKRKIEN